jgi:hypothetical protein
MKPFQEKMRGFSRYLWEFTTGEALQPVKVVAESTLDFGWPMDPVPSSKFKIMRIRMTAILGIKRDKKREIIATNLENWDKIRTYGEEESDDE